MFPTETTQGLATLLQPRWVQKCSSEGSSGSGNSIDSTEASAAAADGEESSRPKLQMVAAASKKSRRDSKTIITVSVLLSSTLIAAHLRSVNLLSSCVVLGGLSGCKLHTRYIVRMS